MTVKLFVYGTLRTPEGGPSSDTHYHGQISAGIEESSAGTLANAQLVDFGAYPGAGPGSGVVRGEVFTVSDETLAITDKIEGHPDFYERRVASINLDDGETVEAWVYWAPDSLLDDQDNPRIESGDWFDRPRRSSFPAPLWLPDAPELARGFERLTDAQYSWFTTVRPDGRPHNVPMWHVVVGNRIYFATMSGSIKLENIASTPDVVVAHSDPQDVVIIDGWAIEADHLRESLAPLFLDKYDWDFDGDDFRGEWVMVEVTPQLCRTWQNEDTHQTWRL